MILEIASQLATLQFKEVLSRENRDEKHLSDSGQNKQRKRKKIEGKRGDEAEVKRKSRI